MARKALALVPMIPALALLSSAWLPFVNTAQLWFGLPSLFVWISVWVLLIPPALGVVERGWRHPEESGRQQR